MGSVGRASDSAMGVNLPPIKLIDPIDCPCALHIAPIAPLIPRLLSHLSVILSYRGG